MVLQFDAVAFLGGLFEPVESSLAAPRPEAPADAQAEAAPERFRPPPAVRQPEDNEADNFDESPSELWAAAEEPGDGCPRCGSLAAWWSILGTKRCRNCEPLRIDTEAIRARVARIRQQTAKWRD